MSSHNIDMAKNYVQLVAKEMTSNFYKDNAELCKTFINESLAQCAVSLTWQFMNKTLSGHTLTRASKQRKVQLGNSKSGRGRLQGRLLKRAFITQLSLYGVSQRWS